MKAELEVLLVDDSPADSDLISASLSERFHVTVVHDGVEAISFLRREGNYANAPIPRLIVLDLNLPRKDGRTVLAEVKADPAMANTPVVIFTTSQAASDITHSYQSGANCYVPKPGNLAEYRETLRSMSDFWLGLATLPTRRNDE